LEVFLNTSPSLSFFLLAVLAGSSSRLLCLWVWRGSGRSSLKAKFACYSSRIIDYFFVTDLSSELIKDTLFRKGSSVGGWHVDALINYLDKAFDYVERDLRELEKIFYKNVD